jgi:hypothetical protein
VDDGDYLAACQEAFATPHPPRRIIAILPYEEAVQQAQAHNAKSLYTVHILLAIQPDILTLCSSPSLLFPINETTTHCKLAVLLLDHNSAPRFHPPAFQTDLESTFPTLARNFAFHPPPWFQNHHTVNSPTSEDREPPTAHPGLEFLTSQPTLHLHTHKDKANPMNGYTAIADPGLLITFLGHPPNKLIYNLLHAAKHLTSAMTPD